MVQSAMNFVIGRLHSFLVAATCFSAISGTTISDIQGYRYLSPLAGQSVQNITGIVTAKVSDNFYCQKSFLAVFLGFQWILPP